MINHKGKILTENKKLKVLKKSNMQLLIKINKNIYEFSGRMLIFYEQLIDSVIHDLSDEYDNVINLLISKNIVSEAMDITYKINKHIYLFKYSHNNYAYNIEQGRIYKLTNYLYDLLSCNEIENIDAETKFKFRVSEIIVPSYEYETNNISDIGSKKRVYLINSFKCNMNCIYCFEQNKSFHIMPQEIIRKTIEFLKRLSKEYPISFVFYGGEPLLKENFTFVETFLSLCLNNTEYEFITNGIGIDAYIDMFQKYKKQISCFTITIDGPKHIHDKRRLFKNSSYEIIMSNIELLLKNDFFIKIRINLDYDNIEYLSELLDDIELNFTDYNKNFIIDLHLVSCKSDTEFKQLRLRDFADNVLSLRRYSFKINVAEQLLKHLFDSASVFATNYIQKDFCNYYDNIIINYNGDIYHCNEAMGMEKFKIANIFDENVYDKISGFESLDTGICRDCPFDIVCKGKCKYENFIKNGSSDLATCNKEEMLEVIKYMIDKGEYDTINY